MESQVITSSIASSAKRRYISYNFEVFRPAEATCCTHAGEIWHSSVPNTTSIGATIKAQDPKTENFTEI